MDELAPASELRPDRHDGGPVVRQLAELENMGVDALRVLWRRLYRKPAPPFFRRELLVRGLAYQIQAKAYGDLSPKTHRKLMKIAAHHEAGKGAAPANARRKLRPGTRLVRAWQGVTHTVNVLEDGYEWAGTKYRSLSAIAKAISGTNWNGFNFFGLDKGRGGDDG